MFKKLGDFRLRKCERRLQYTLAFPHWSCEFVCTNEIHMRESLSTRAIPIGFASGYAAGQATQEARKVRHGFPALWDTIRCQCLRCPALVLTDAQATPGLQICYLAHGQIAAEPCPYSFNWVEIAAVGRKPHGGHAILFVCIGMVHEGFIVVRYMRFTL